MRQRARKNMTELRGHGPCNVSSHAPVGSASHVVRKIEKLKKMQSKAVQQARRERQVYQLVLNVCRWRSLL